MKSILNIAAVAAVLSLSAVAAQAQVQSAEAGFAPDIYNAQSTLSRQQVSNAVVAARKDGTLPMAGGDSYTLPMAGGDSYTLPGTATQGSTLARSDVQRQATARGGNSLAGEGSVQ